MESVIKDQLLSRLASKGLINKYQHGFISKHFTITNSLECIPTLTTSLLLSMVNCLLMLILLISVRRLIAWYTLN